MISVEFKAIIIVSEQGKLKFDKFEVKYND